jgi:NhaA family Na+:H+ antiporter
MFANLLKFFRSDAFGGVLLGLTAIVAIIMQNSSLAGVYEGLLTTLTVVKIGSFEIAKPLLLWINDGLMAIFFLLVGLEIKREIICGSLSSRKQFTLPALAALGGLTVPALIYSYFNWSDDVALHGWAIPAATDIAFALGIILLLGNRVPNSLKLCLVAIAIIDDLAAIVIIALFYTEHLSLTSLGLSGIALIGLAILNWRGVHRISPYIMVGILLWVAVLKSGVHATLAGVIIAMFIPMTRKTEEEPIPLLQMEKGLHPWVTYFVLPVFAFANAGVSLQGLGFEDLLHPITLGITLGLFFGKQIGVMTATYFGQRIGLCSIPDDVTWLQYYGMALVTGIGFTMSLFIGTLAFNDVDSQTHVRLGVIAGSLISGICGFLLLRYADRKQRSLYSNV